MFKNSEQTPTLMPPSNNKLKNGASGKTTPMENISIAVVSNKKAKDGLGTQPLSPSMPPPAASKSADAAIATVTAWNNGATINALWSINQDKNSWIGDAALGWKKLSYASESGIVALTMLSCHAKQMGSTVNYRTEDDGMVHEIYVW
jgi:hypothetical protein